MAVVVPTWAVLTISHVAVAYLAFRFGMAHYRVNHAPDGDDVGNPGEEGGYGHVRPSAQSDDLGAASADDLDEYPEEELR